MNMSLFELESEAERKFKEFDSKNPQVYNELVKLTRQAHDKGRKLIGIKMLVEVVRWNRFLQTTDEDFKINNNYCPFYSRKIMEEFPEFEGIFNVRKQRVV